MRPIMSQAAASPAFESYAMVARQPIYNNRMGVFGYELLFRSPGAPTSIETEKEATQATAQVLTNSTLTFDLNELVCNRNAVFNVSACVRLRNCQSL